MSDEELTPEQKFSAEDPEILVVGGLIEGRSKEELIEELLRLDWSPRAAAAHVDRVATDLARYHASPESRRELIAEARRGVVAGFLLVLIAVGLTAATFLLSLGGAPYFLVPIGILLMGLVLLARSFPRWRLYRSAEVLRKRAERGTAGETMSLDDGNLHQQQWRGES